MKKLIALSIMMVAVLCAGAVRVGQLNRLSTHHGIWTVVETCTSADDETTALAVGERTFQTVLAAILAEGDRTDKDGEIEWLIVPTEWNTVRFAAIGITEDGTYTVDVHSGTLPTSTKVTDDLVKAIARGDDCNLTHIGTLAFVIGTQVSTTSTYELADAVTVTTKDATVSWTAASNAADDTAEARIDLQGANVLIFVPTACSADSKLLATGY